MPIKPDEITLGAKKAMEQNPDYGKDVLRVVINETPELRAALLEQGLIKEVDNA